MRHAKAEQYSAGYSDINRELTFHGLQEASRMGKILSEKGLQIDAVICSSSARTQQTAELVSEQIGFPTSTICVEESLYEASVRTVMQTVNGLDEKWNTVLIVGHNPALSYLPESLTSEEIGELPTAGIVALEIKVATWKQIDSKTAKLLWKDMPANHGLSS